eukprot:gene36344-47302_t
MDTEGRGQKQLKREMESLAAPREDSATNDMHEASDT